MQHRAGQAYGQDLRDRVLAAQGTIRAVAARFDVSDSYVCRVRAKHRATGDASAGAQRNRVPARLLELYPQIRAFIDADNSARLVDTREWLAREHGVRVSMTTVWKTLARLGLTLKKRSSTPPSKRAPT